MTALADTDPQNPVAIEVARLITGYTENFAKHCERIRRIPEQVLASTPQTPIERVARDLFLEQVRAALHEG